MLLAGEDRGNKQQCRKDMHRQKNGKARGTMGSSCQPGVGAHHHEVTWRTEEVESATEMTRRCLLCPSRPREEQLR